MPDPRLARTLSALLPQRVVADAFEPAWEDLRIAYLIRRQRMTSPLGRAALRGGYQGLMVLLFLDCWRLAILAWIRREVSTPTRRSHPVITEPKQTERFHMFLYLIRHAFRQLVREPAFTVAALLTLALGVGANAAVFAVVEAVLLRPLPYPSADNLVILNHRDKRTGITKEFIAIGDYIDLSARQKTFESIGGWGRGQTSLVDRDDPYRVDLLGVGANTLDLLRVRPVLGRLINADGRDRRRRGQHPSGGAARRAARGHVLPVRAQQAGPDHVVRAHGVQPREDAARDQGGDHATRA